MRAPGIAQKFVGDNYVDGYHPDVPCHLEAGTDYCVMDYDANDTDAYSEFCYNGDPNSPNHIRKIRGKTDGI